MKAIRIGVGGWPAIARGSDVPAATPGVNIGMAGFVAAAEAQSWELAPTLWRSGSPSAQVREANKQDTSLCSRPR